MPLPQSELISRLCRAKYLFESAVGQSKAPEFSSAFSLLSVHDAVEWMFVIACDHVGIATGKLNFMEYWKSLDEWSKKQTSTSLGHRSSINRLNDARVSLKHKNVFPAKSEVISIIAGSEAFLSDSFPLLFSLPYESLSLADLIEAAPCRDNVKESESRALQGAWEDAIKHLAAGMHYLCQHHLKQQGFYERSYKRRFSSGRMMAPMELFEHGVTGGLSGSNSRSLEGSLVELWEIMDLLCLGIDIGKLWKFKQMTPEILWTPGVEGVRFREPFAPLHYSQDNWRSCYGALLDMALTLQAR